MLLLACDSCVFLSGSLIGLASFMATDLSTSCILACFSVWLFMPLFTCPLITIPALISAQPNRRIFGLAAKRLLKPLKQNNWDNLDARRDYLKSIFIYKILNNLTAPILNSLLIKISDRSISYNSRQSDTNLVPPIPKSESKKRSFQYSA